VNSTQIMTGIDLAAETKNNTNVILSELHRSPKYDR
jgi:hypothetical protein